MKVIHEDLTYFLNFSTKDVCVADLFHVCFTVEGKDGSL